MVEKLNESLDMYARIQEDITLDLLSKRSVYLSGSGGTGKSVMLSNVFDALKSKGVYTGKTSSTGVSAVNISGTTLHSFLGIGLAKCSAEELMMRICSNSKFKKKWKSLQVLIIDEISMISRELFEKLNTTFQLVRKNTDFFGGVSIFCVGDFLQLPPVEGEYLFKSEEFLKNMKKYTLTFPWRFIKDNDFFYLLQRARYGTLTSEDHFTLQNRITAYKEFLKCPTDIKPTILYSTRADVHAINMRSLHSNPNVLQEYKCYDEYLGDKRLQLAYKKIMDNIAPEVIHLKKGAQVMLTRNLNLAEGLANGSRGVVLECNDAFIEVKFVTGTHLIQVESWEYFDEPNVYTRYQFPLILAYALTIHKSQSCSLDSVVINLGKNIFLPNMGYVSLSRCRNLSGLYLVDYSTESVYADEEAMEYERSENERSEAERSEAERKEAERNVTIEECEYEE